MDDSREGVDPPADGRGDRFSRIEEIYHQALDQPEPERLAFLRRACGTDESLRREVERLLSFDRKAGDFMQSPALDAAAQALARKTKPDKSVDLTGQTFLHYKVIEKIGAGGMGVVYKALDTHLKRPVAIKVLPPERLSDPERRRRFIQEARAASALNHPNIVTIYDIDQSGGTEFIAMEYVPGKTLSHLIPRKGMRTGDTLKYAIQIADALAAAHTAGIVHRDLKPANVIVTDKGQVKLLDFGLAKLTETLERGESETTETLEPRTEEGTILGTVAYMSPEQAEGKAVNARSDIFSFGSVLYQMVTGRRAFEGDSRISTLSAILHQEPKPVSTIASGIPTDLEKLINRCLRKDPERRIQHMDDVKLALADLQEDMDWGKSKAGVAVRRRGRYYLWISTVLAAGAVLAVATWLWLKGQHPGPPEAPLTAVPLTSYPGHEGSSTFSPDGTQVAFQWCPEGPEVNCDIYIKQIGVELPFRLTSDPAEDFNPAWSPDSRFIAFLRRVSPDKSAIVLVPQRGGPERVVGESDAARLAWTPDSKWLAFSWPESDKEGPGLFLLNIETRERRRLTTHPFPGDKDPAFSPHGRSLTFTRAERTRSDIYLLRLGANYEPTGPPERLPATDEQFSYGAAWMPDGKAIVFTSGSHITRGLWRMAVTASAKPRRLMGASEDIREPAASWLGNRLAYTVKRHDTNIWRVDLSTPGSKQKAPVCLISSTRHDGIPAYSPDGKRIAFTSDRSGTPELWVCNNDGSNPMQLTAFGRPLLQGVRWSPDGQNIAFYMDVGANEDIYIISATGGAARRLTTDPAVDRWPCWTRDGQSIYFKSSRGATPEVWKIPAVDGEAVQVTHDAFGDCPHESPDGRFVFYSNGWPDPSTIWRQPIEGGEPTKVLEGVHPDVLWTVGPDGIYFFAQPDEKGHSHLSIYEFTMGKSRKILTIERPVTRHLAVSPDGGTVLYTQIDESGSDLMLVENFR